MLKLRFEWPTESAPRILCLGAHSDDIEIGCGGTILKLTEACPNLDFLWVVFGSAHQRTEEAHASAGAFLSQAKSKRVTVREFRDGYFPYIGAEIKDYFEQIKAEYAPDLIFTHFRDDLHQDHRVISDLTWNTFRNHLILEYEIPKYDGDLGSPNLFVHLDEATAHRKVEYLLAHFATQANKHWFTSDTFTGLMRLRGIESSSPTRYAEAFYARKLVMR